MTLKYFILYACLIGLTSCYEQTEGCIDLLASNYTVSADKSCEDCCTYPTLNLQISHLWDDAPILFNDTISPSLGPKIILLDQSFYIYNTMLQSKSNAEVEYINNITFTINSSEQTYPRDIVIIKKSQPQAILQNIRSEGLFDSISFTLGLPDYVDLLTKEQRELYDAIKPNNGMTDTAKNHYTYKLSYLLEPMYKDTLTLAYHMDFEYKLPKEIIVKKGENTTIPIKINYNQWYAGINFSESPENIITLLKQNVINAIE